MNKVYSLDANNEVTQREATVQELATARETALARLKKDPADWAMRSCWNCNPAHNHFLRDVHDGSISMRNGLRELVLPRHRHHGT